MPLRADGSPLRTFRSPGSRIAAPACLPEVCHLSGVCRTEAPRSQLRDSSGFAPDSLGALPESYRSYQPTPRSLTLSPWGAMEQCGES